TDLGRGATGTGVGVDVDGVHALLVHFLAFAAGDLLLGEAFHHRLGNKVVGTRPDVDDLVVLLALGYETRGKLRLDLAHFGFRLRDDARLGVRNHEVVHADGGAGQRRVTVTHVHQLVGEDHRFLQSHVAVALVDDVGDLFLGHLVVDQRERQAIRHDGVQDYATNGGVPQAGGADLLAVLVEQHFGHAHLDARVQVHGAGIPGLEHFVDVGEHHALALGVHALAGH